MPRTSTQSKPAVENTSGQTNDTTTTAPKVNVKEAGRLFKVTNEKLGTVELRVKVPEATEADLDTFYGEGEEGEKNRTAALVKYIAGERSKAVSKALRTATRAEDATAEAALKSLDGLKFAASRRGKGTARKPIRAADLDKAIETVGLPKTKEDLAALLASLNVNVE